MGTPSNGQDGKPVILALAADRYVRALMREGEEREPRRTRSITEERMETQA
jgi:hypothetical protein